MKILSYFFSSLLYISMYLFMDILIKFVIVLSSFFEIFSNSNLKSTGILSVKLMVSFLFNSNLTTPLSYILTSLRLICNAKNKRVVLTTHFLQICFIHLHILSNPTNDTSKTHLYPAIYPSVYKLKSI